MNINDKNIHRQIKQILIDQYKQKWHADLQTSSKGRIYCSFKSTHGLEPYIKILPEDDVLTLFKYRTANHRLPVETGRYDRIPFNDRTCTLCTNNQVGSEEHYLLECPHFDQDRTNYMYNHLHPAQRNISYILTSSSEIILKSACIFIRIIMKKFSS